MDRYFTCFVLENADPTKLHMTHKYLGEQSEAAVQEIMQICEEHFNKSTTLMPKIVFDEVDYLGEKYKRVVKCQSRLKQHLHLDLRAKLDHFRKDDYAYWLPHITHPTSHGLVARFSGYALLKNGVVLKWWLV